MSKFITTTEQTIRHEIEIEECLCGNEVSVSESGFGRDGVGTCSIHCELCGLGVASSSNNIGYGDSELMITYRAIEKWNYAMRPYILVKKELKK